jgi:hypothetical protein
MTVFYYRLLTSPQQVTADALVPVFLIDDQQQNGIPIDDRAPYQSAFTVPSPIGGVTFVMNDSQQGMFFPADVGKVASEYL